ncbi:hypothetical protein, partial [Endozoicomonas sp.]|uniref:hypothetical protein n=1 Tax=Endozoicomonas sp. TaxID=1892382 RepID=UPI00383BEBB5
SIYCHFGGDLVGQILRDHFPNESDAREIINLGDISFISNEGPKAYRSTGAPWVEVRPKHSSNLQALLNLAYEVDAEFLYYWQEGQWHTIQMNGPRR